MDELELPSGLRKKEDQEEKEVQKIIKSGVVVRKQPLLIRIFRNDVVNEFVWDIIIPAAKSTISDIIANAVDTAFYGEDQSHKRRSSRLRRERGRTVVSYNNMYNARKSEPRTRNKNRHVFDDVIIESRQDAEDVLSTLVDLIDMYNVTTVSDFYDACGIQADYTDAKYGWDNLSDAYIRPVRGGYIISLPRPKPLE